MLVYKIYRLLTFLLFAGEVVYSQESLALDIKSNIVGLRIGIANIAAEIDLDKHYHSHFLSIILPGITSNPNIGYMKITNI